MNAETNQYRRDLDGRFHETFIELYQGYQQSRNRLHNLEKNEEDSDTELYEAFFYKEMLANLTFAAYSNFGSFFSFKQCIEQLIADPAIQNQTSSKEIEIPFSTLETEITSPLESLIATTENLEIAHEYADVVAPYVDGMLLSGSNAWGPFFAVKGENVNKEHDQTPKASDIDLLLTGNIDTLYSAMISLVNNGLLSSEDLTRFSAFKNMYISKQVDTFWTTGNHGKKHEIHFLPTEILRRICSLEKINIQDMHDQTIDFVRVLRPNIPKSVQLFGGYPTVDIKGLKTMHFTPRTDKITIDSESNTEAYLSQMTVGGPVQITNKETYYIGVIPFFLLISPRILIDREGLLSEEINKLRKGIMKIVGDGKVTTIPREERMSNSMEIRIKNSLKQWD